MYCVSHVLIDCLFHLQPVSSFHWRSRRSLHWCQKWDGTTTGDSAGRDHDEDFERAWIQFDLVTAAKKWDNAKQLAIIPALLHGKLVDFCVELSEEDCAEMQMLKKALSAKAGLARDPLSSAKCFNMRKQGQEEKVADFARDLKKLFSQAYPSKSIQSLVLLQCFLTVLLGSVSQ